MRLPALILTALLLLPAPAFAQDMNTLLDIPDGATMVNLSVNERVEVDQDLLVANLQIQAENNDGRALQDEINKTMKKAVDAAKAAPTVKVSTQSYQVYPYDQNPDPKRGENIIRKWRGSQELMLKSTDSTALLKLTGDLQEMGLNITSLNYTVSPELLEETQNSLLEGALLKLKTKADRTAKALGKNTVDLLNINVDTGGYYPQPMMMGGVAMDMMSAKAEMASPVAEAGQSEISLNVSAQVLIK
ncbi:MAG: SIMPL domain-containing protein [Alphaproteobacteria bacterium]|nr:SIMPL domain-containing protein [Alphaproteobacteria bacterium]